MASREPKKAARAITSLLTDPRVGQDQRDQLLKARRALERLARSGKMDKRKVYRVVEVVARIALDIVKK